MYFKESLVGKVVNVFCDNTSAIFYFNNLGGTHSKSLCMLALEIWEWMRTNSIDGFASHVAGNLNTGADFLSRFGSFHEYCLSNCAFDQILKLSQSSPTIDLFASRDNYKLRNYVSLANDPAAFCSNAFSFTWPNNVYCFPHIPLVSKAVKKFFSDEVDFGIVLTPAWPSLPCINLLSDSLVDAPILIHYSHVLGCLPTKHPFLVMAWPISANSARKKSFAKKLSIPSSAVSPTLHWPAICDAGRDLVTGLLARNIVVRLIHP